MSAPIPDGLAADQLSEWNEFLAWKRRQAAPASVAGDDDGDSDSEVHDVAPDRSDPAGLVADAARARRPVARVHLHRGHFAFMRCYIEGLDIGARWDHYLGQHGEATDLRAVHRAVRQLRGDLVAIARRHDRHGLARRFCRISIPSMADQVSYGARTLDESPCSTSKGCAFRSM